MTVWDELKARGLIAQVTEKPHFTLALTLPQTAFMLDISWHCA